MCSHSLVRKHKVCDYLVVEDDSKLAYNSCGSGDMVSGATDGECAATIYQVRYVMIGRGRNNYAINMVWHFLKSVDSHGRDGDYFNYC